MRIDNRYNLAELASRIEAARTAGGFEAFAFETIASVLESGIDFQPIIPDVDRAGLIRTAMHQAGSHGPVTAATLTAELQTAGVNYLRRPLEDYVLATSINVPPGANLPRHRLNGASLTFSRHLPAVFSREVLQTDIDRLSRVKRLWEFTHVRVRLKARTYVAAFSHGMDRLDLLRGMWNLRINSRTAMRFATGQSIPLNAVRLGPVHTLHRPDGELATESFSGLST